MDYLVQTVFEPEKKLRRLSGAEGGGRAGVRAGGGGVMRLAQATGSVSSSRAGQSARAKPSRPKGISGGPRASIHLWQCAAKCQAAADLWQPGGNAMRRCAGAHNAHIRFGPFSDVSRWWDGTCDDEAGPALFSDYARITGRRAEQRTRSTASKASIASNPDAGFPSQLVDWQ